MSPDRARHDDVTVQVPTTEPPQGVPPGQFGAAPPVPVVPPVPPGWPELPQPPSVIAIAAAMATELKSPTNLVRIPMDLPLYCRPAATLFTIFEFFESFLSFDLRCR
jgi:hypothetical protein